MKKGENWNHPAKGSSITVEPIRNPKDIKAIKRMLAGNPRDYCIFVLGINTNLRASDILNLRVRDVQGQDELVLKEKKTGVSGWTLVKKNMFSGQESFYWSSFLV